MNDHQLHPKVQKRLAKLVAGEEGGKLPAELPDDLKAKMEKIKYRMNVSFYLLQQDVINQVYAALASDAFVTDGNVSDVLATMLKQAGIAALATYPGNAFLHDILTNAKKE